MPKLEILKMEGFHILFGLSYRGATLSFFGCCRMLRLLSRDVHVRDVQLLSLPLPLAQGQTCPWRNVSERHL